MRVVTRAEVEAAAAAGIGLAVDDDTLVTPLARDRAAVLGVAFDETTTGSEPSHKPGLHRLVKESKVRMIARRALLKTGRDLSGLEDLVTAVMLRVEHSCGCEGES